MTEDFVHYIGSRSSFVGKPLYDPEHNIMDFASHYTAFMRGRYYASSGSAEVDTYVGSYDTSGRLLLTPSGRVSLYDDIQSYRDSVDINTIVKRYTAGDTSVMSRVQGLYADVYNMPSNLAELYAANASARRAYDGLDPALKSEIGTYDDYLAMSDDDVARAVAKYQSSKSDVKSDDGGANSDT